MSRPRYTADEAATLIAGSDDLGDIQASNLEDAETDDGEVEVADYVTSSGMAEVLSHHVLHFQPTLEDDADEPAFRNSLLLLDSDLHESDEAETEGEDSDMEVEEASEAESLSGGDGDDGSPLSSTSSDKDTPPYSPRGRRSQRGNRIGRQRGRGRREEKEEEEEEEE